MEVRQRYYYKKNADGTRTKVCYYPRTHVKAVAGLQEAIAALPDAQGVSAQVVTNTAAITALDSDKADQSQLDELAQKVDEIGIKVATAIPQGGVLAANVMYNLGTLSGNIAFEIGADTSTDGEQTKQNVYAMTFAMPSSGSAPTITYPANLTWVGGSVVTPALGKKYELSIMNHIIAMVEV